MEAPSVAEPALASAAVCFRVSHLRAIQAQGRTARVRWSVSGRGALQGAIARREPPYPYDLAGLEVSRATHSYTIYRPNASPNLKGLTIMGTI